MFHCNSNPTSSIIIFINGVRFLSECKSKDFSLEIFCPYASHGAKSWNSAVDVSDSRRGKTPNLRTLSLWWSEISWASKWLLIFVLPRLRVVHHLPCELWETFAWKKSWNGSVMKSIDMELYLHSGRSSSLLVPKWIQRNLLEGNVLDNKESIAKLQCHFQELVIAVNMESNAIGQGLLPVRNSHRV